MPSDSSPAASRGSAGPDRGRDMRARILGAAREELAEAGPGALSVRSIARRLGVAAGGLYRYVAGRDDLLTALVVEAYEGIGAAAERAAAREGDAAAEAWVAAWLAVREHALERPHEFALVYGTPVIGYAAPARTIDAATRLITVLAQLAVDARPGGDPDLGGPSALVTPPGTGLREDLDRVRDWSVAHLEDGERITDAAALGVLRGWTEGIGTIGFELHGHYVGSVEHGAAYLEAVARAQARSLGLPGA